MQYHSLSHIYLGSERSAESIRTKIIRIMSSYKEAHERLNNTGSGLQGIAYTNLQEYVVKNICKYYFELDPVLKNRPNVYPWFTNEKKKSQTNDHENQVASVLLDSDDSSTESRIENNVLSDEVHNQSNFEYDTATHISSSHTNITNNQSLSSPHESDDNSTSDNLSRTTMGRRPTNMIVTTMKSNKLSPTQAKKKQKTILSKKRKTNARIRLKGSRSSLITLDDDEKEVISETRKQRINFEFRRHNDMKSIENEKLAIDKERLKMEKDSMLIRVEQITAQTNVEKNRNLLLRLEIFKERQTIKKEFPDVTDEYLNENFPYPT